MAKEYGTLAFQRVFAGVVNFPDGEPRYFDDVEDAEKAWTEWVKEAGFKEAVAKAKEDRQAFIDGCEVRSRTVTQPGVFKPDVVYREIFSPDGKMLGNADEVEFEAVTRKAALARFPEPELRKLLTALPSKVEKIVIWEAGVYRGGKRDALPPFRDWSFGFPIEEALAVLNDLAAEGWQVIHVSEDRGIFQGITNQTDSYPTKVRYLLARDS